MATKRYYFCPLGGVDTAALQRRIDKSIVIVGYASGSVVVLDADDTGEVNLLTEMKNIGYQYLGATDVRRLSTGGRREVVGWISTALAAGLNQEKLPLFTPGMHSESLRYRGGRIVALGCTLSEKPDDDVTLSVFADDVAIDGAILQLPRDEAASKVALFGLWATLCETEDPTIRERVELNPDTILTVASGALLDIRVSTGGALTNTPALQAWLEILD